MDLATKALPVPGTAGPGTHVAIGDVDETKTIFFSSTTADLVYLELSADNVRWSRDPNLAFTGNPPPIASRVLARYARAYRETGSGGTLSLQLVARPLEQQTAQIAALTIGAPETDPLATHPEIPFHLVFGVARVRRVALVPHEPIVGDPNNYATIFIRARDAAGGPKGRVATLTTETSIAALAEGAFTLEDVLDLEDGDVLTREQTKTGAGVLMPVTLTAIHLSS
jgi:hypothetical protein